MAKSNHWQTYHRRWSGLEAPLRSNAEITEAIIRLVGDRAPRVLLLGVTPELALAFIPSGRSTKALR